MSSTARLTWGTKSLGPAVAFEVKGRAIVTEDDVIAVAVDHQVVATGRTRIAMTG